MNERSGEVDRYQQLQQEHAELRELLGNIHRVLSERLESVARVSEMLASLSSHIEAHFKEEEVAGFFDEIVEHAPRLSSHTEALRSEHTQLLAAVRALSEAAGQADLPDWWQRLEQLFREFSKELMKHEVKENDLLQEAFTEDIGSQD